MIKGKIFSSCSLLLKSLGNNNPVHKSVVPSKPYGVFLNTHSEITDETPRTDFPILIRLRPALPNSEGVYGLYVGF